MQEKDLANEIIQIGNLRDGTKVFPNPQAGRVYSVGGIAPTLNTCGGGQREPKVLVRGSMKIICERRIDEGLRMFKDDVVGTIRTIDSGGDKRVIESDNQENEYRIRKLTPKECWRLMGFSDNEFEIARSALNNEHYKGKDRSSSQLYKQAGNSIVVDVLYYIFKELYTAMPYLFDDLKVSSYFSGIGAFESALDRLYKNNIDKNSQKQLSNSLLSKNDNEAIGVASRGRYNESKEVEQHYETKKENIAYCVTTIQKDSMVMEKANKQ